MLEQLRTFNPVTQALIATLFTWGMTAVGAGLVFFAKKPKDWLFDSMLGFAAGVMISASFLSLLMPAIAMSKGKVLPIWFPPAAGFLIGTFFIGSIDRIIPHLRIGFKKAEGLKSHFSRSILLILAITLHNIPEGLAVGIAFGSVNSLDSHGFYNAIGLAIGIGIQNLPEGFVVSMPLRAEGFSRLKSFNYGQLSAIVEPIAAVLGAAAVTFASKISPYALSFAAGCMIFVVIEELIPESQRKGNIDLATISTLVGFVLMMILDLGFS